ncbi:MAG TPA: M1 family metallopeptidase [Candidatus Dormibacteraeota bacterium]|nr:M1 family metallopeptidase [Candidatus Dormibacteraeota bacterium]
MKKTVVSALLVSVGSFLLCMAPLSARVSIANAPGPLPKTVIPLLYDITVVPNLKTMKIAGNERIVVDVVKATKTVVVDALQTSVQSAKIDGISASSVKIGKKSERITMNFPRAISVGKHTLTIAYTATVQNSSQGLFVQKYQDENGKPAEMIGTQMEATDARRMFPGWDEPAFRAKFHLTATVPRAWTAVSNMPIAKSVNVGAASKRVTFETTPPMSTYLLVLCAGNFDRISGSANGTKINVYGTKGKGPELTYALHSLERLIPYYEKYYGIKFPLPKLDMVAIPGFFGGAMENWGGMTFTEDSIVYNPKIQPRSAKRGVFDIIAHETSHQWNGDLTTMAWWDGLWLNEGFATWMETKATEENNPTWHRWLGFDESNNGTMLSDARGTTHPVQMPVHNETEANEVFDELSYQKAGAFLRMMEAYLGPQTFRKGLHAYFTANEYANTVPSDLWSALSKVSHQNIARIAHSWIDKPGFPAVAVTALCQNGTRTLNLTQQRYTSDGTAPGSTVWAIPLNIETSPGKFTPVLFDKPSMSVPGGSCNEPLVLNGNDIGYYRVSYDKAQRALQQKFFRKLSVADRLELLDNSWTFAEDGKARLSTAMAYVNADAGDTDPHVVGDVLALFGTMAQFEHHQPGEAAFKSYEIGYLRPLLAALGGWDGPSTSVEITALRESVIGALAYAGDTATIAEAQKRFALLAKDPTALAPGLKDTVVSIVGRNADEQTYAQLMQMGMTSHNPIEMQSYMEAAFIAKDPALARKSLQMSLHLPAQFQSFAPVIVAIVGQDHPRMGWAFLLKHTDKLFGAMSGFDRLPYVSGIAAAFWRGVPPEQIDAYLKANLPAQASLSIDKAMKGVHLSLQHRARLLPQIDAFVKAR